MERDDEITSDELDELLNDAATLDASQRGERPVAGYGTPEEAVRAEDSVPAEYAKVIAVEYSQDDDYAVVCVEYNEPPAVEPYVILCERTAGGWTECQGGSGGGLSWMSTSDDGSVGVEVAWGGSAPSVRWDVPAAHEDEPRPRPDDLQW